MNLKPWPSERGRPWPEEIEAGLAPHGLVFRVYAVDDGTLLHEDRIDLQLEAVIPWPGEEIGVALISTTAPIEAAAADAADAADAHPGSTCLVVYDGDTGARVERLEDVLGDEEEDLET